VKLVDDIEHFWKFWSVRLGVLAAACGAGLAAWGAANAIDPRLVRHFPQWTLDALSFGSVIFSTAAVLARAVAQPRLQPPPKEGDKPCST
jgi:hypothetical protein